MSRAVHGRPARFLSQRRHATTWQGSCGRRLPHGHSRSNCIRACCLRMNWRLQDPLSTRARSSRKVRQPAALQNAFAITHSLLLLFVYSMTRSLGLPASSIPRNSRPCQLTVDFNGHPAIFEAKCFRCHGTERPKSRFASWIGNRRSRRDNGVDIIPQKRRKPTDYYVARGSGHGNAAAGKASL